MTPMPAAPPVGHRYVYVVMADRTPATKATEQTWTADVDEAMATVRDVLANWSGAVSCMVITVPDILGDEATGQFIARHLAPDPR